MPFTTPYAIASCGLLLFLLLPRRWLPSGSGRRAAALLACLALALLPLGNDLSPAAILRGMAGDLSIVTVCWLAWSSAGRIDERFPPLPPAQRRTAGWILLLAAVLLYPSAMGATAWDSYRLGFGPWLPLASLALVLALTLRQHLFLAAAISLALLARALHLLESNNLWDYLLDPGLAVYGLVLAVRAGRPAENARSAAGG